MKYALAVIMALAFATSALALDFPAVHSKATSTRNEVIVGKTADGETVYQGKKGGYYWKDQNGKKHYIKK